MLRLCCFGCFDGFGCAYCLPLRAGVVRGGLGLCGVRAAWCFVCCGVVYLVVT